MTADAVAACFVRDVLDMNECDDKSKQKLHLASHLLAHLQPQVRISSGWVAYLVGLFEL